MQLLMLSSMPVVLRVISAEAALFDMWCSGHMLPARYIIHTVGPIYDDYSPKEAEELLASAHRCQQSHILPHNLYLSCKRYLRRRLPVLTQRSF